MADNTESNLNRNKIGKENVESEQGQQSRPGQNLGPQQGNPQKQFGQGQERREGDMQNVGQKGGQRNVGSEEETE